jgi:hypothetical protein
MRNRKTEYSRMLHLAVDEENAAAAAEARFDEPGIIDNHRAQAEHFRALAGGFAPKPKKS